MSHGNDGPRRAACGVPIDTESPTHTPSDVTSIPTRRYWMTKIKVGVIHIDIYGACKSDYPALPASTSKSLLFTFLPKTTVEAITCITTASLQVVHV